jgi:hypothetical protein
VAAASLGDEGPLRFEVRYVYTGDEHPRPGRDPGEPVSRVVHELAAPFEELAPCTP